MNDKEKTEKILEFLEKFYNIDNRKRTFIKIPELRLGTGYNGNAQRRMDYFVISSNAGNNTICYEIKVSKQDYKNDINKPLKQRGARLYSNEFYYITPKGLLTIDDIPIWAGLIEVDLESPCDWYGYNYRIVVPAPFFDKATPSWSLIGALTRKVNKEIYFNENIELKKENEKLKAEVKELKKRVKGLNDRLGFSLSKGAAR